MANTNPYAGDTADTAGVYRDPSGAAVLPPGIGSDAEVNQANTYDREQQWYQQFLKAQGQDPNHIQLSDKQREELMNLIRQHGVEFSSHFEIDQSGNIHPTSSLGKDILEGVAIGGAALTGLGLAGVGPMAGLFGAGSAAADAGVGTGAAEAGAEAGAGAGLLPSTAIGSEIGLPAGGAGLTAADVAGGAGAAGAAGAGGAAGGASGIAGGLTTAGKFANALKGIGAGFGKAATAAGGNALDQEKLSLEAAGLNIQGQNAADQLKLSGMSEFEKELMDRASLEQSQRGQALKDIYRQSYASNPRSSPYDPAGPPKYSQDYLNTLSDLTKQGTSMLSKSPQYGATSLPTPTQFQPTPYSPIDIKNLRGATGTQPGFMEQYGGPISAISSGIGAFLPGQNAQPTGSNNISQLLGLASSFGGF